MRRGIVARMVSRGCVKPDRAALAWVCAILLAGLPARGEDATLDRARRLALEGRCAAVIAELERHPETAESLTLEGRCLMRTGRHDEAARRFERAADAGAAGLGLDLVEARYHAGDLPGARRALETAEANDPDRGRLQLYKGLLLLDAGRASEGATALERARVLDRSAVEPVASLQAGNAWRAAGDRARARAALERVVREWPGTDWAAAAERALRELDEEPEPSPWFASLELGYEYDTNVVLRGSGVALPSEITSERDDRFVWDLEVGRTFDLGEGWRAGLLLQDVGALHDELRSFDVHAPSLVAWLDRALAPTTLARVELDVGYAWVDRSPFLVSYGVTGLISHAWGRAGASEVSLRFHRDGYFFPSEDVVDGPGRPGAPCVDPDDVICGPRGLDERRARNRDGNGFELAIGHLWEPHPRLALGVSYRYDRFSARGAEYTYDLHEIELLGVLVLPLDFLLSAEGAWGWQRFRHPSTFPDPADLVGGLEYPLSSSDRRQRLLRAEVTLEKPLTRHATLLLRYRYTRERSNVAVFDYRREVLGAYLRLAL